MCYGKLRAPAATWVKPGAQRASQAVESMQAAGCEAASMLGQHDEPEETESGGDRAAGAPACCLVAAERDPQPGLE